MHTLKIKLNTMDEVRNFVQLMGNFESDVDLISGRYMVDAKSLMGIFSLDLSEPITLQYSGKEKEENLQALHRYIVNG